MRHTGTEKFDIFIAADSVDLDGYRFILDGDADTYMVASGDDHVHFYVSGQDNLDIQHDKIVMTPPLAWGTSSPNTTAAIDITSTTKGLLLPRMTTTQRNAIVQPPAGLCIFNTTTTKLECYDGTTWQGAW